MISLLLQFAATKFALSCTLAILAWAITRRVRSPQVAHVLWLLPLVTMLIPTLLSVPILPGAAHSTESSTLPLVLSPVTDPRSLLPVTSDWQSALILLWAIGALVLLVRSIERVVRFHRVLSRASHLAPPEIQLIAAEVASLIGLRQVPTIITTDATLSPLVWWIGGKTRVVVPTALFSGLEPDHLRCIIAHELAHVARRDHIVRWIEWCACILFWWNPVAWLARRALHTAEELCCDAVVIATLKPAPRRYAQALMFVVDWMSQAPALSTPIIAITAVSGGRTTHLQERFTMIVSSTSLTLPSRLASTAIRLSAAILLPLGLLGVTSAPAQVPAKTGDPNAPSCEALAKEVKLAVAAGTLTERQGVERIAACTGVAAPKNADALPSKVASGDLGPIDQLRRNIKTIQAGIDAGTITPDDGKAKIAAITKQIDDRLAQQKGAPKTAGQCAEIQQKIKSAVEAGAMTAEEGKAKIVAECGKIGG